MSDLYIPGSYLAEKARQYEVEVSKALYGPGVGQSVVLGPLGGLDRLLRERGGEQRHADKSLYYQLYSKHPFIYACVELICQTAAQDRHTYPADEDAQKGQATSGKPMEHQSVQKAQQDKDIEGEDDDLEHGSSSDDPKKDGIEFLEQFFAEINDYESFQDLLAGIYRDVLISGEAYILKQRMGSSVRPGVFQSGTDSEGDAAEPESGDKSLGRYTHVQSDPKAEVVALFRIPSRDTWAVGGQDGYPKVFRQRSEGGGFREYAKEDVIFVRFPDPNDPSHGLSPLEALDLSVAADIQAAKYNEAFFRNGAKAGIIISMQGLSEHEIRRNNEWINTIYVKPENAHKPMTLLGNVQLVRDGDKAANDMEFLKLRQFTREEIAAVYSVPLSKLIQEGGGMGQAGKMTDDITFRADTVGPLQSKVYDALNRQLMRKDFQDKPLLIPPRQEKVRLDLLEAAKSLVQVGGTGNEARAILHLPEYSEDPAMNRPLFLQPGIKPLPEQYPDQFQIEEGQQLPYGVGKVGDSGGPRDSQAGRADKKSTRTSQGQSAARTKKGVGMKTRA